MPSPVAVPPLATFNDAQPVRQGALNALARHIEHLHAHLLAGWRTRKPLTQAHLTAAWAATGNATLRGDYATYVVNDYDALAVDTETDHPDGRAGSGDSIRVRTSGNYLLTGQASVTAAAGVDAPFVAFLCLNGTSLQQDTLGRVFGRYPVAAAGVCVTVLAPLAAGSVVRLLLAQDSGVTLPLDYTSGGVRLTAEWVAPLDAPEDLRED